MAELSEFVRSPKRAKTYLYICEGLSFLIGLVVILALIYLWQHFNWWHFLIYVFIGSIVISFIYMLTIPWIKYKYMFYSINECYVQVNQSFYFKSVKYVKLERIQFLEIASNPLLKRWGIAKLTIVTAGHEIVFPLMNVSDALAFEALAMNYLEGVDSDV